jgi:nucleotide-binding universal stress UspA family protein
MFDTFLQEGAMGYKDILVFLDPGQDTDHRLELAATLCRRFDARLIGVDVTAQEAFSNEYAERALRLQEVFEATLHSESLTGEYRVAEKRTTSWKDFYAHYADLVVASQRGTNAADTTLSPIPDEIVANAGVPVLVLPVDWMPVGVGQSVVIAWNSSRESTRALHDALPMLHHASRVTVFEYAPPSDHIDSAPQLVQEWLDRHGIRSEVFTWPDVNDASVTDTLFTCIDRQRADLVVAGAFGHSSFAESLFGSVSQDLLHNWSVPVLMSH